MSVECQSTTASDEEAIRNGCVMDVAAAERVREFLARFLKHSKGQWAGKPFELLDWQWHDVVMPLFGWKRPDGTRRFRKAYIEIPKKNGKTTLCAALSLYLLIGDNEPGAEIYSAAYDREQASMIYRECASMVKASTALSELLEPVDSKKTIKCKINNGWYRALSAETQTSEGLNIHGLIFDELHVQKTRRLWDTVTYGGAARRQPLQIAITTAGVYEPESIGWEQHEYGRQILSSEIIDPYMFAYIRAADVEDDWEQESTWQKANPSYGHTITRDDMEAAAREAANQPRKQNSFLRYRLNVWTQQLDRWIDVHAWNDCGNTERPPLESLAGEPCWVGLDLSSTRDLTAMAVLFKRDPGYLVYPFFWLPEAAGSSADHVNKEMYATWARQGHLRQTDGDIIDYPLLRTEIAEILEPFDVRSICYDPREATQIAQQLQDEDGHTLVKIPQGYRYMNAPSKEFERLVSKHYLWHGNHPILSWCAANVAVKYDQTQTLIMPEKPREMGSPKKIDGVVAVILALCEAMQAPAYDDEIIVTI